MTLSFQMIWFIPLHAHSNASQPVYILSAVDHELKLHGSRSSKRSARRKLTTGASGKVGSIAMRQAREIAFRLATVDLKHLFA